MGLFSTKKTVYVSSVAYNMAGEYAERMSHLKTITVGSIFNKGSSEFVGESIVSGLIQGPYRNQINLLRWAKTNHPESIPNDVLGSNQSLNVPTIEEYLSTILSQEASVISAVAGYGLAYYWALQYVKENYPELDETEWTYDIQSNDPSNAVVVIQINSDPVIYHTMVGYDITAKYAYIRYTELVTEYVDTLDGNGDPVTIPVQIAQPEQVHIYKFGSGNSILDPIEPEEENYNNEFMPVIPIRLNNKFITETPLSDEYEEPVRKMYKKITGATDSLDNLIESLEDNDDLDDIDYAFLNYGVALNTKTKECKRYLFEFMLTLMERQTTGTTYAQWRDTRAAVVTAHLTIGALKPTIESENPPYEDVQAYNAAMEFYQNNYPGDVPTNKISQKVDWLPNQYMINHYWIDVEQTLLTGVDNPAHDVGDIWLENLLNDNVTVPAIETVNSTGVSSDMYTIYTTGVESVPRFNIYRQISATNCIRLTVYGLSQENVVYAGKATWVTSKEALDDEDESDLIIPMHMTTFKKISLKARNQVACENTYIVFNCYQIVKQKWYQRSIFKFIFAIVIAVLSVFLPPVGSFGAGILGSNLAVGTALGIAGSTLTVALVGALVNAVAAIIVSSLLSALLPEKWANVVGALVTFAFTSVISFFQTGLSGLASSLTQIFNPQNILKITDVLIKGINDVLNMGTANAYEKLNKLSEEYENNMENIQNKFNELLGTNSKTLINPYTFYNNELIQLESPSSFLQRTLLTGSDLVNLHLTSVTEFVNISMKLPDNRS